MFFSFFLFFLFLFLFFFFSFLFFSFLFFSFLFFSFLFFSFLFFSFLFFSFLFFSFLFFSFLSFFLSFPFLIFLFSRLFLEVIVWKRGDIIRRERMWKRGCRGGPLFFLRGGGKKKRSVGKVTIEKFGKIMLSNVIHFLDCTIGLGNIFFFLPYFLISTTHKFPLLSAFAAKHK